MAVHSQTIVGANSGRSRSHNRQVVLAQIRAAGQVGRAEVARASGLSTQAISNIIADLLDDGMIVESGRRAGGRGLPAVQYALNPRGGFAFGAEVRPDAIFVALLDLAGNTMHSRRYRAASGNPETVTLRLRQLFEAVLADARVDVVQVLGAGVVMPGPFGATGISGSGTELPGWAGVDPRAILTDALGVPVFVENDANAAAMAERVSGVAQGLDSYAYLYFGAGLGLGMVHQGRLMAGAYGNAGEIGHIPIPFGGRSCALETAVSRMSVARHMSSAGHAVESGADLARLYADRSPALLEWLDAAAPALSTAIGVVENLLDPEVVILGGAMPEVILDHMVREVSLPTRSVSNRAERSGARLVQGTSGNMTATLGAAALVINQTFTPMIAVAD